MVGKMMQHFSRGNVRRGLEINVYATVIARMLITVHCRHDSIGTVQLSSKKLLAKITKFKVPAIAVHSIFKYGTTHIFVSYFEKLVL